jgi:hypothetical protein
MPSIPTTTPELDLQFGDIPRPTEPAPSGEPREIAGWGDLPRTPERPDQPKEVTE